MCCKKQSNNNIINQEVILEELNSSKLQAIKEPGILIFFNFSNIFIKLTNIESYLKK